MTAEGGREGRDEEPDPRAKSATVLGDRAIGLLAVASAVAVWYYPTGLPFSSSFRGRQPAGP